MCKMKLKSITITILAVLSLSGSAFAQFSIGSDLVSRYVWRGTDFGNAASVQPSLSYALGNFEIGAWASYPIFSDSSRIGVNENDLYLFYRIGNLGITLNDYYFPEANQLFNYKSDDAIHLLEISASYNFGKFSLLGGFFFSGDTDNSTYFEAGYNFYEKDEITANLTVGAGNGFYSVGDGFGLVNIGLTVSKGPGYVAYVVNPDQETNFLVFGFSISLD